MRLAHEDDSRVYLNKTNSRLIFHNIYPRVHDDKPHESTFPFRFRNEPIFHNRTGTRNDSRGNFAPWPTIDVFLTHTPLQHRDISTEYSDTNFAMPGTKSSRNEHATEREINLQIRRFCALDD